MQPMTLLYKKRLLFSNRLDYHSHEVSLQPRRLFRTGVNVIVLHDFPLKMVNLMRHAVEPLVYGANSAYAHQAHAKIGITVGEALVCVKNYSTGTFYLFAPCAQSLKPIAHLVNIILAYVICKNESDRSRLFFTLLPIR